MAIDSKTVLDLPRTSDIYLNDYVVLSQGGVSKRIAWVDIFTEEGKPAVFNMNVKDAATTDKPILKSDAYSYVRFTSSSDITVTLLSNQVHGFNIGEWVILRKVSGGDIYFDTETGVSLNSNPSPYIVSEPQQAVKVIYVGDNRWDLETVSVNATGGGSGGQVDSVTGENGVAVDSTDPANPVASLSGYIPGRVVQADFTLSLTDAGQFIETDGTGPFTISVPEDSAFGGLGSAGGMTVYGFNKTENDVIFAEIGNVNILTADDLTATTPSKGAWQLVKSRALNNTWFLFGYLGTVA